LLVYDQSIIPIDELSTIVSQQKLKRREIMDSRLHTADSATTKIINDAQRAILENSLSNAFRRGTSAFRLGLIQAGPSDHLPYSARVTNSDGSQIKLAGWNLLADCHLYNNFMNITGKAQLSEKLCLAHPMGNVYFAAEHDLLYYFFSELAQFLYQDGSQQIITISSNTLETFCSLSAAPSKLALSRDPVAAAHKQERVEKARQEIISVMLSQMQLDTPSKDLVQNATGHEFKLSIKHALELIHHIKHAEGALQWSNRFKLIANNKLLSSEFIAHDFMCLQECTNPDDIDQLCQQNGSTHASITHAVTKTSSDYCVLLYDKTKFEVVGEPIKYDLDNNKKPCIFAKFRHKVTQALCIVASIHHPGGKHNYFEELLGQINLLRFEPENNIPYYMLGDFNHTHDFFSYAVTNAGSYMHYPAGGTMAGSDYGNVNQAIDALATNMSNSNVEIYTFRHLAYAPPAPSLPFVVKFATPEPIAYPGFFQRVGDLVGQKDLEEKKAYAKACESARALMGKPAAKRIERIKLS
jgi:hypothetical protein